MNRRFVVVGAAALLAGTVLTASIVLGPPALRENPVGTNSSIGAAGANEARDVTYTIIQRGDTDEDITRTVLKAERLQRLPRGVSRLTLPRAEMRYSPTRAMTISADSADVIMVDNQPQRGTFSGNVVLTLFEAQPGQSLITDSTDPRHTQFISVRVFLDDETDFDLATNDVDTNGAVHVTSPQVDFFGQGLKLKYNTTRKRVEQLVIAEGRYLMFNPDVESAGLDKQANEDDEQPVEGDAPAGEPVPSQFYLASFRDRVLVRQGKQAELFGDLMDLRFSLGTEAITPKNVPAPGNPVAPDDDAGTLLPAIPGWRLVQAEGEAVVDVVPSGLPAPAGDAAVQEQAELALPVPLPPAQPVTIPPRNAARSMFVHDPDRDVVVTWSGLLRLSPLNSKPDVLVDDQDVQFKLSGEGAYAESYRDDRTDRIEAGEIEYLLASQLVNALAPEGQPIRLVSSTMGDLEGTELVLNQKTGVGTIFGPGKITQLPDDQGKALVLTWTDRLDLELFVEPADDAEALGDAGAVPAREGQMRVVGLKTATFRGEVTANHPDFDLTSGELTLAFREPSKAEGIKNDPRQINAAGDVVVNARGDAEDEQFAIAAQALTIDLAIDDAGDLYATAMRALLEVKIQRPGSVLTCRRVDVAMAPPGPKDPGLAADADAEGAKKPYAQVRSLVASDNVRAELDYDGRRVDLAADQLVADVAEDRITLISNDVRSLAEVFDVDDNRRLSGKVIVMDDQAESVAVDGPGALFAALADEDLADAALAVTWDKSMRFNNIASEAFFVGNVNATSLRSTDQTELTADELDIRFSPDPEHDPARLIEHDLGEGDAADREVRSTIARGNVKFVAAAFEANQPQKPYNRIRIEGPKLTFTNHPRTTPLDSPVERLVVDGVGRMLIEDYRLPDNKADTPDRGEEVAFTGRGATLFVWKKQMALDARANTATFTEDVQMVHQPREDDGTQGEVVQLDCQTLVADMEDGGGLGVWMSDEAPDAQITVVTADENVRLTRGTREMSGDHLKYVAADQVAELWADEDKEVVINDRQTDTPARAARAIWDLAKDRIELRGTRGGAAPTR